LKIAFDLDGILCHGYPYTEAKPFDGAAELLVRLKKAGHHVTIFTARGMGRNKNDVGSAQGQLALLTLNQLRDWGFTYDAFLMGKPSYDLFIDDKAYGYSSIIDGRVVQVLSFDQVKIGLESLL
jgi:hypothetical protein